jgi:hypothetical protein
MAGYGAGNRAPQFYQTCYDSGRAGRAGDIAMEHAIAVLRQMRRGGDPLSTADAIAITHHAGMLARLRGRGHATLDDIDDASSPVAARGTRATGTKLRGDGCRRNRREDRQGDVPGSAGCRSSTTSMRSLPISISAKCSARRSGSRAARQARTARRPALGLPPSPGLSRNPVRRPGATGGDFSGTIFREDWRLKWEPDRAGAHRAKPLRRHRRGRGAQPLRERLRRRAPTPANVRAPLQAPWTWTCPNWCKRGKRRGTAIDSDPLSPHKPKRCGYLGGLDRYAVFRGLRRDSEALLTRCYDRACFALPGLRGRAGGGTGGRCRCAGFGCRHCAAGRGGPLRPRAIRGSDPAGRRESPVPFLRGAFLGLLCEIRELPADALAAEVAGLAGAAPDQMVTAGDSARRHARRLAYLDPAGRRCPDRRRR